MYRAASLLVVLSLLPLGCASTGRGSEEAASQRDAVNVDAADAGSRTEELIASRVPGVRLVRGADGSYELRVRGGARLDDRGEPLLVVDGSPTGPDVLAALSPSDIRTVRVLKGPAAARYGSRAARGVIEITTR